ncbi:MAG: response regulator [Deltaproteobacteria bacterium]|nr:response regulator [Deltaproteobacteria bacterium]
MGNLNIFIVDDDVDFAESLADIFELEGHKCELAYDGETALKRFKENDFDLTFMDVKLPGKNGVESFLDIRKVKPDARVIMMTGFSVEELLEQAMENGAWGVLHKPLNMNEVLNMVKKVTPAGILIVDDNPDFLSNIKDVLEHSGFIVYKAKNGEEAISHLEENHVDILILDLRMPILNGLETFLLLKEKGIALPTIIVTAYAYEEADTLEKLKEYCVNGILRKPFDPEDLITILHDLVDDPKKICF